MAVKNSGGDAVVKSVQVMGAHAVILPLVIYAGLEISGSHFNPVVTACFVLAGKLVSHAEGQTFSKLSWKMMYSRPVSGLSVLLGP